MGQRRQVDVAQPVVLVADVAFRFEDAQLRPHRRGVGVAGQIGHHLGGGGAAATVEDVHDLAFAAGEDGVERLRHML